MARKVEERPALPSFLARGGVEAAVPAYASALGTRLSTTFLEYGYRINRSLNVDGSERMEGALRLQQVTEAQLPVASEWPGAVAFVTDRGQTAVSDGTSWGFLDAHESDILDVYVEADRAGAVDARSAILSAIATAKAAAPRKARVVFPKGRYLCSDELGTIAAVDDLEIEGNGSILDFTGMSFGVAGNSKEMLHLTGSYSGSTVSLTADAAEGDTALTVSSTAGLAAGDTFRLAASTQWDPNRTDARVGELLEVDSIDSGTVLTVTAPLAGNYTTAASAFIEKVTMARRVVIRNLVALGPRSDAVRNLVEGLKLTLAHRGSIENCHTYDCGVVHQRLIDCTESKIIHGSSTRAYDDSQGYGASCMDACQDCLVAWNRMRDTRHAFTTNNAVSTSYGITRRITVLKNIVYGSVFNIGGVSGDALDTHAGAEDIRFLHNTVYQAKGMGINVEARSAVVEGNQIFGSTSHGIFFQPWCEVKAPEARIVNNLLRNIGLDDTSNARGILVQPKGGNASGTAPVFDVASLQVLGNDVESKSEALYVLSTQGPLVAGNVFRLRTGLANVASYSVRLSDCEDLVVNSNRIVGVIRGLSLEGCADGQANGNVVTLTYSGTSDLYGVYSNSPRIGVNNTRVGLDGSSSGASLFGVYLAAGADYSTALGTISRGFGTAVQDSSTGSVVANTVAAP